MSEVLDLTPLIQRRRQSECRHERYEVSMTEAILACRDCGAPLDPWWVLRSLVERKDELDALEQARLRETEIKLNAWLAHAQAEATRLTDEIARLYHERSRILADPVLANRRRSNRGPR